MRDERRALRRWITAAVVAGTLGFGSAQALAAPRESEQPGTCTNQQCNRTCKQTGYDGGFCLVAVCVCYGPIS
ncbi:MAG TPA: hypothetical protein VHG08_14425 [Longimicrobium sp.]|nr:hypothetical protein [Longimicrobium sp.]